VRKGEKEKRRQGDKEIRSRPPECFSECNGEKCIEGDKGKVTLSVFLDDEERGVKKNVPK